jgi:hypothetical protein
MNKKRILVLMMSLMLCMGFSLFEKTKWVWHKGEYSYVRLAKPDKEIDKLEHPAEISQEQIQAILTSIRYQRAWINLGNLVKPKEYDLFTAEEAEQIAPYLAQGLKEANSNQWVDFSLEVYRGQMIIFGSDQVTDGVAFVRDGKLNLAFRNISEKIGQEVSLNIVSPLKAFPGSARLIPGKGMELAKNKKGKDTPNWLIIDLKAYAEQEEEVKPAETKEEKKPEPEKKVSQPEQEKTPPRAEKSEPEKPQPTSGKSVKERLLELRELYEQGLITEEQYNKRREEILKEL